MCVSFMIVRDFFLLCSTEQTDLPTMPQLQNVNYLSAIYDLLKWRGERKKAGQKMY